MLYEVWATKLLLWEYYAAASFGAAAVGAPLRFFFLWQQLLLLASWPIHTSKASVVYPWLLDPLPLYRLCKLLTLPRLLSRAGVIYGVQ